MKKNLLALALVSAGLLAAPAAFAQNAPSDNGGWFINGNVGRTSIDKGPYDGHDTGYALNGGYRWSVNPNVAPDKTVAAWGSFRQNLINVKEAGSLQAEAVKLMDRAGYK